MRAAIILSDTLTNIIEAESLDSARALFPDATVADADATPASIGWRFEDSKWTPPAPPAPIAPAYVSAASAKIALYEAGLLTRVETAVAAHKYEPVRIWYSSANSWLRSHAYVNGLGAELGLSEEQIDALFAAAAKIDGTPV